MDPISAIAGFGSGVLNYFAQDKSNEQTAKNVAATNAANLAAQREAQGFNAQQAQLNRDFQQQGVQQQQQYGREMVAGQEEFQRASVAEQERYQTLMSNTAYQRSRADMEAAGLNPMMMFGHGAAASSPFGGSAAGATASSSAPSGSAASSGGLAHQQAAEYRSPVAGMADVINKTISNAVQVKAIDKMAEEIANLRVTGMKTVAETESERERPELIRQQAGKTAAEKWATNAGIDIITNAALTARNQQNMNSMFRKAADVAAFSGKRLSETLSPISDFVGKFGLGGIRRWD